MNQAARDNFLGAVVSSVKQSAKRLGEPLLDLHRKRSNVGLGEIDDIGEVFAPIVLSVGNTFPGVPRSLLS
jgi:hypothetical protein